MTIITVVLLIGIILLIGALLGYFIGRLSLEEDNGGENY